MGGVEWAVERGEGEEISAFATCDNGDLGASIPILMKAIYKKPVA